MEETKTKKSGLLKLVVAFLAGVVLAVIVLLATTGGLFMGEITRIGERITVPEGVKDLKICTIDNCDLNEQLEYIISLLDNYTGTFNDFTGTFNDYTGAFNDYTSSFTEFTSQMYDMKIEVGKELKLPFKISAPALMNMVR